MLQKYLPILIFLCLAGVLGVALFTIGWVLGPRRPDAEKLSPYECGFQAFEDLDTICAISVHFRGQNFLR